MADQLPNYEKLGWFYLGKEYDLAENRRLETPVLYDSKDLLTHAVCVGMTGSGKTGLCIDLLEEAAIDGIPAIVIDPKGDLANLLLTFPKLTAESFRPWISEDDARRQNLSVDELAAKQAARWEQGLAEWDQDAARIGRLKDAAEFSIYTPGSSAGESVSIVRAFQAPPAAVRDDSELLSERVNSTVTGLLSLVGINANPLESREHILLSQLLERSWKQGEDQDLTTLIQQTQKPPLERMGALEVEAFFPASDRFALATRLNNLLSAPGFSSWLQGAPLDIGRFLHTSAGKPRIAIFSIAHLDDAQRMFFVSLLLNEMLAWTRTQSGTTSLRALLYMDEIFGYFPPVANPPSKQPLLTLLKQARAFGVGVVLATQNPIDLDYKGLSNAGTWWIGRLQTERDQARVLDGLQGAMAGEAQRFDRQHWQQVLSGLKQRVFLMHNVHEDAPVVFEARWAMSYLAGPLGRDQIKRLMQDQGAKNSAATAAGSMANASADGFGASSDRPPLLEPGLTQYFIPQRGAAPAEARLLYQPRVMGLAAVNFVDKKRDVSVERQLTCCAPWQSATGILDWGQMTTLELEAADLESAPVAGASFGALPSGGARAKEASGWTKSLADALYRIQSLELLESAALSQTSQPDESERDFRIRMQQAARERRDAEITSLRDKNAKRIAAAEEKIRKAQARSDREQEQARGKKWQTVVSFGASILQMVMGRKKLSIANARKVESIVRNASGTIKETGDVARAEDDLAAAVAARDQLAAELEQQIAQITANFDPQNLALEKITVRPRKTDVVVRLTAIGWLPYWQTANGTLTPAWS